MAGTSLGGNPLLYLFKKMWHYSAGNRKTIVWFWLMFAIAESISMVSHPLLLSKIMNLAQAAIMKHGYITRDELGPLWGLLALTVLVDVAFWTLHGPARVMERRNGFQVRANYRKYLQKGVMALPMEWHVEHHSGETSDKMEKGTEALLNFSEESYTFIYAGVQLIVSYAMLAWYSPSSACIVIGMILVAVRIIMRFDRVLMAQYAELNRAENKVAESVIDAITNITTVIILRVEQLVFRAIVHRIDEPFDLYKRNTRVSEVKWFLTNVCATLMAAITLGVYFTHSWMAKTTILIGNLYILIKYLDSLSRLFFEFCWRYSDVIRQKTKVMNAEELSADFRPEALTNHVLPVDWKCIEAANLNFSYDSDEGRKLHLDNVSFTISRGERIALVGETGGGKSTLLRIIRDIYHPQDLALFVDGKPIPEGFGGIKQAITYEPQDPEMFATTILKNVTMGAEYDFETVLRFTDMACFTDVVRRIKPQNPGDGLREKFDYSIEERGLNLSPGQRQRLALARGFLACQSKDIVLLDEPTSSTDAHTGMRIHENLIREFSEKTIISATHQLHLLPFFHRIFFIDDGQIVATGTLDELLLHCPLFQALWRRYHERRCEAASF